MCRDEHSLFVNASIAADTTSETARQLPERSVVRIAHQASPVRPLTAWLPPNFDAHRSTSLKPIATACMGVSGLEHRNCCSGIGPIAGTITCRLQGTTPSHQAPNWATISLHRFVLGRSGPFLISPKNRSVCQRYPPLGTRPIALADAPAVESRSLGAGPVDPDPARWIPLCDCVHTRYGVRKMIAVPINCWTKRQSPFDTSIGPSDRRGLAQPSTS